jgi:glutaredoxin 3
MGVQAGGTTNESGKGVVIYTTLLCPYCHRAKALLRRKGVVFTEIDVGMDAPKRAEMTARAGGRLTVPQIFIGGTHVGGCDDLHALDDRGALDPLLEEACG